MIRKTKTIVVLGMHRSGTSMIGGILSRLGINMGEEFIGKSSANPLGHFEDKEFVILNDAILEAAGGSWDSPPKKKSILNQQKKFNEKIRDIFEKKQGTWGWKDPRTSLTIDLFMPYLTNVYFIICHRNFDEVAKSLKRRSGMGIKKGIKLREVYEERINDFFSRYPDLPRLDVHYENMTTNPGKKIKRLINFLQIEFSNQNYMKALDFILPNEKARNLSDRMNNILKLMFGIEKTWKVDVSSLPKSVKDIINTFLYNENSKEKLKKLLLMMIENLELLSSIQNNMFNSGLNKVQNKIEYLEIILDEYDGTIDDKKFNLIKTDYEEGLDNELVCDYFNLYYLVSKLNGDPVISDEEWNECIKYISGEVNLEKEFIIKLRYRLDYLKAKFTNEKINYIIWGASNSGKITRKFIEKLVPNFNIIGYVDKFKEGSLDGVKIYNPNDLNTIKFDYLFISTTPGKIEAENFLKNMKFKFIDDYTYGYGVN